MLKINGIETFYGNIRALKGISLDVPEGSIVTLLGANGAGKTTTLKTISGITPAATGTIEFMGQRIDRIAPEKIVRLGISHVPEGREVFKDLTVMENLKMGAYTRKDKREIAASLQTVYAHYPILRERRNQLAGTLSGGEQQMLAIGRALMSRPKLLLLDEPSLGLAPVMTDVTFEKIGEIHKMGTAILLVEQNVSRALSLVQRAYVLESGNVIMHGSSDELANNKQVQAAYLGI